VRRNWAFTLTVPRKNCWEETTVSNYLIENLRLRWRPDGDSLGSVASTSPIEVH
jgi:hypothetical protein